MGNDKKLRYKKDERRIDDKKETKRKKRQGGTRRRRRGKEARGHCKERKVKTVTP